MISLARGPGGRLPIVHFTLRTPISPGRRTPLCSNSGRFRWYCVSARASRLRSCGGCRSKSRARARNPPGTLVHLPIAHQTPLLFPHALGLFLQWIYSSSESKYCCHSSYRTGHVTATACFAFCIRPGAPGTTFGGKN